MYFKFMDPDPALLLIAIQSRNPTIKGILIQATIGIQIQLVRMDYGGILFDNADYEKIWYYHYKWPEKFFFFNQIGKIYCQEWKYF